MSCQLAKFREGILETVWPCVMCQVAKLSESFSTLLAPVWIHVCLMKCLYVFSVCAFFFLCLHVLQAAVRLVKAFTVSELLLC